MIEMDCVKVADSHMRSVIGSRDDRHGESYCVVSIFMCASVCIFTCKLGLVD